MNLIRYYFDNKSKRVSDNKKGQHKKLTFYTIPDADQPNY